MFWQHEYIRDGASMTLAGTYKLDLPEFGLLGSLLVRISGAEASGYGQGAQDWKIIDEISKVVVLGDASTVIKSLTGYQVKGIEWFDQGVMAPGDWRMYATNEQREYMLINFGRWYGDTEYGLDLSKFNNVEIQITNTATSSDFSALSVSIMGAYLRDAPASQFKGHMRTEEWKRWTTVAAETVYNDLPVNYPMRRVFVQALPDKDANYLNECAMEYVMSDIDFTLDTGQVRVWKGSIRELMRLNLLAMGRPAFVAGQTYQTADYGTDIGLGRIHGVALAPTTKDGAVASAIATLKADELNGTITPEVYTGDEVFSVLAEGFAPFYLAVFDFDLGYDPTTWLDPNARKTVKLDIETYNDSTAADGTAAIILDRLVRH